jgi:hypothetical protein
MYMSADFLARLCSTKDSNDWNLGLLVDLGKLNIAAKERIELRRGGLVVVYAVQSDAKEIHSE